ncbi:unnamed protein product [Trichobilharzia szidati]|nr:unnamed protein product [Trichobilharzia szidati]
MYGVLFEVLRRYVESTFGETVWSAAVEVTNGQPIEIHTRQNYSTRLLTRIVSAVSEFVGLPEEDLYYEFGITTVQYLTDNGFKSILRVLGKNFVDFMHNINELHEYLRFSYPKLKAPGIQVTAIKNNVIDLEYSSVREQFPHYLRSQLIYIAKNFYQLDISAKLVNQQKRGGLHIFSFKLYNKGLSWIELIEKDSQFDQNPSLLDVTTYVSEKQFLGLLPFHLLLTRDMKIRRAGPSYLCLRKDILGQEFTKCFQIAKPKTNPTFDEVYANRFTTFELVLLEEASSKSRSAKKTTGPQEKCRFKGEISFVEEWDMLIFMGSPLIRDTKQLYEKSLRISDLNMFDRSREIIFEGEQQSDEMMKLFEKQRQKSKQMEKAMAHLEKMRKVTDDLLYQCIPRPVARKIRNGTPAMETIQTFDEVTICFTKVVNFAAKCMHITVEQVIELLNKMYSLYDALTENHKVYKVETISDSYMLVSGVPSRTPLHAAHIIDTALDIIQATLASLYWPVTIENTPPGPKTKTQYTDEHLHLYVGCHTGPVVAGVVGYKTPRYCLFGDTVNTSSRMMSHGLPNQIHISESCAQSLSPYPYIVECRGEITIKGKGGMKTYIVTGRKPEFTVENATDGSNGRSFADILKEDLLREEETPSEDSEDGSVRLSIDLSDKSGTTEGSEPGSPKDEIEELEMDEDVRPIKEKRRPSRGGSRRSSKEKVDSSKNEDKRRRSKQRSNPASPIAENGKTDSVDTPFVNNQNTTEMLNQAARRLVETKINDVKNEQKMKQDITFNLDNPKEIMKESPSEPDLQAVNNQPDEAAQFKSKNKPFERSRLIKLNPANRTAKVNQVTGSNNDKANLSSSAEEILPTDNNSENIEAGEDNDDQNKEDAVQQFRDMVKQNAFDPVPAMSFCSPQGAMFKDLASNFMRRIDENFTEFWEGNMRKLKELGC